MLASDLFIVFVSYALSCWYHLGAAVFLYLSCISHTSMAPLLGDLDLANFLHLSHRLDATLNSIAMARWEQRMCNATSNKECTAPVTKVTKDTGIEQRHSQQRCMSQAVHGRSPTTERQRLSSLGQQRLCTVLTDKVTICVLYIQVQYLLEGSAVLHLLASSTEA